jgi:xanthine dehydrogenase accessory factor
LSVAFFIYILISINFLNNFKLCTYIWFHLQIIKVNYKDIAFWTFIEDKIKSKTPIAYLQVVESIGSSPGRQGFKMVVNTEGPLWGSIGGGIMEFKLVEYIKVCLKKGAFKPFLKRQIHDKSAAKNQSGMICSGEQTVLFYCFQEHDLDAISKIIACLSQNTVEHEKRNPAMGGKGVISFSNKGFNFSENKHKENKIFIKDSKSWSYEENLIKQKRLYILGSGHCALALSRQMSLLTDFYIHLFDNRDDLNTYKNNTFTHEKEVVNFEEIGDKIPSGEDVFVVIMSFGYRTDAQILRGLFGKQFAYIGMLGSETKIKKMFTDFENEGYDKAYLDKIHAPIGLIPHTKTPEEIAVSIAAQIIQKSY